MGRKAKYSPEFKAQVVEYYKTHSAAETAQKFNVSYHNVTYFVKSLGFHKGSGKRPLSFKHEVCQYYDNHTCNETVEKFGISLPSLFLWRRELGYRNKSRGYNLYTEGLQPAMKKRERHNFMMTRDENGQLKAELVEVREQYAKLEQQFNTLKSSLKSVVEALQ